MSGRNFDDSGSERDLGAGGYQGGSSRRGRGRGGYERNIGYRGGRGGRGRGREFLGGTNVVDRRFQPRERSPPRYGRDGRDRSPTGYDDHSRHRPYARYEDRRGGFAPDRGGRGGRGYWNRGRGGSDLDSYPSLKSSEIPSDLPQETCFRLGIIGRSERISKSLLEKEVERVGFSENLVHVMLEKRDEDNPDISWCRYYFDAEEVAEQCLGQMLFPGRSLYWSDYVAQLLPVPQKKADNDEDGPAFKSFTRNPSECLCVEIADGHLVLSSDQMYSTKGLIEFFQAKDQTKKNLRRMICKHFDPEKKQLCRYGAECNFLHVKTEYMSQLLRTFPHHRDIRIHERADQVQFSSWEYDRRHDSLLVRDMPASMDLTSLKAVFQGSEGMMECIIRSALTGQQRSTVRSARYGVVRFDSPENAAVALAMAFDLDLNISLFGVLEDIRLCQIREAKASREYADALKGRIEEREKIEEQVAEAMKVAEREADAKPGTPVPDEEPVELPFPPLPEGWLYGISRKQDKYYFYQTNAKGKTNWRHPVTNEVYSKFAPAYVPSNEGPKAVSSEQVNKSENIEANSQD